VWFDKLTTNEINRLHFVLSPSNALFGAFLVTDYEIEAFPTYHAMANLLIALRNITRNRKRALTALLTIAAGVIAMVLADGFIQWIYWAMREATIQSQLSHIQIVRPGYFSAGTSDPFAYLLPEKSPVRDAVEAIPGVKLVAPRLAVTGLISYGDTTVSFIADGVDPKKEAQLSKALRIVVGKDLTDMNAQEVILGRGLARTLGIGPGATIALLATSTSGGINAVEARVSGLFVSANQAYDDAALRLPIPLAQSLLRAEGAHSWLVLLNKTEQTDHFLDLFRTRFPQKGTQLDFVPWYTHADFYNKTVALFSQQMKVLRLIIGFIIILSISNLLVMNVLERTGEIGTLLAVGFRRSKIMQLFAVEGLMLGLVGGAAGVAIGYGLAELISTIGIPMPPPPGMEEGYTAEILVTLPVLANAFAIAFVTTALAGIYPAWKASRLIIINALRHNI
jgi:putative ABC transport system permease protein